MSAEVRPHIPFGTLRLRRPGGAARPRALGRDDQTVAAASPFRSRSGPRSGSGRSSADRGPEPPVGLRGPGAAAERPRTADPHRPGPGGIREPGLSDRPTERTTPRAHHAARQRWLVAVPLAATAAAVAVALAPPFGGASSHREAPSISEDPTADNTDVYAFRSPDAPDTATLVANFVPFEEPAGGPNFYRFSDDVKYEIKVDNTGDGKEDVTYEFRFDTKIKNPNTFLYNTEHDHVRRQEGRVHQPQPGPDLHGPQDHQGPQGPAPREDARPGSPDPAEQRRPALDAQLRVAGGSGHPHVVKGGTKVFAGQRDDPFFVDLGGIFDLLGFRSAPPGAFSTGGVDGLKGYSVNTIAIQVPITQLTGTKKRPDRRQRAPTRWSASTRRASRPVITKRRQGAVAAGLPPRRAAHQRGRHPARARRTSGTAATRRTTSSSSATT